MTTLRRVVVLGFAGMLAALPACTTNAATGRSQLNLLSRSEEIAMGEGAMPEMIQEYGGAVTDPTVTGYVAEVGGKLTQQTESNYAELPWEFTVLDSDVLNAFALPGGKVFISRGLAEKLNNEAELAFVLGHECGHVTAQHVDERMSRQYALAFGGALVGAVAQRSEAEWAQLGGQLLISGAGVYALKFDRNQESEADSLGIRYMAKAGWNPIGAQQAMQVLADESKNASRPPEFLSTHPNPETRLVRIGQILESEHPDALTSPDRNTNPTRYQNKMLSRLAALDARRRRSRRRVRAGGHASV
ncbi:MAG: M48 family metalloprotease [Phycisphaerales bacterium]